MGEVGSVTGIVMSLTKTKNSLKADLMDCGRPRHRPTEEIG